MYREIEIKGDISIEILNTIYETLGNIEGISITIKIIKDDFKNTSENILINGKNSHVLVCPNVQLLKKLYRCDRCELLYEKENLNENSINTF